MAESTISERLFVKHCAAKGVACERLEESTTKVADYAVILGQIRSFVEIKQLDPNDRDLLGAEQMSSGKCQGAVAPTRRVRDQLAKAYKQLKPYSGQGYPCLVVLFNNAGFLNYIDNFTVTTAMFGTFGVRLKLGADHVVYQSGQGFGSNRKVTKNTCRGISAVCVLSGSELKGTTMTAYHNPFASVPIQPSTMSLLSDAQFKHENPHGRFFVPLMADAIKA